MRYSFKTLAIIILLLSVISSCDAPRDNPLDPRNPDNSITVLEGRIETVTVPRKVINNVSVVWQNNLSVQSDESGYFKMENIERENGWLFFRKNGFSSDSIFIDWRDREKISVNILLNSTPKLDNLILSSIVFNRYPNNQIYQLEVRAKISDDERDVDSVFIKNEKLNLLAPVFYNYNTDFYERTFSTAELNLKNIDEVIGKDLFIIVKDEAGKTFEAGSSNVKRIIKQEIVFDSPKNNETVAASPKLRWNRFTPGFAFEYKIQIFTNVVAPDLIFEKEKISSGEINYQVESGLPSGEYFWVIWAIDEFKNKCRSKPATFTVE